MTTISQDARLISVIIPSYNRSDALPATLGSLARQTLSDISFEVILVDDGSSDGSVALVERLQPELPYELMILRQENRGPGAARNHGARCAHHDLLLFWDSDMIAVPQTLAAHAELQAEAGPGLVAGARRALPDACSTLFGRIMYLDDLEVDQFTSRTPSFQEVFSSNLSINRRDFWRLGGFDETLWSYEDIDLAYRAQHAGMPLLFSRQALGYHNHPMTLEQACRQQEHYQERAVAFLVKHPELEGQIRHLIDKTPVRWGVDSPARILRKLVRRIIAASVPLHLLEAAVVQLEKHWRQPAVLEFLYWKILASYQLRGYQQGLREFQNGEKAK